MLSEFIIKKLKNARYKILEDGSYFGAIPGLKGVWASANDLERCREELRDVLEDWLLLKVRDGERVLVMFAGVAPFSIVIAKNSKAKKIFSNEINREANKYAKLNIELNNLKNRIELIPGDIKKIARKGGLIVKGNLVPLHF